LPGASRLGGLSTGERQSGGAGGQRTSGPLPTDPTAAEGHSRARRAGPSLPPRPTTLVETGLDASLLQDLALKLISNAGTIGATALAAQMRLPLSGVLDEIFTALRKDGAIEVVAGATESARAGGGMGGATGLMSGSVLVFRLTEQGKMRAREAFERNGYAGPAPVSFSSYTTILNSQIQSRPPVMRSVVHQRLSHLVLSDVIMDQVGVAVNRGGSLFLWGHAGNGKTAIAEAIATMLSGGVFLPHAIEISGHVVPLFDPSVHVAISLEGVDGTARMDERWVYCRPPLVHAGGELTLSSLDLQFNERLRLYESPLQVKASTGVLLIDDFGRQQCRPQDLLNRWIVPLERGVDFLTLINGQKVVIPFGALVVFSSNMRPSDLVDEAFLRRVPNKIWVSDPAVEHYREILVRACQSEGVAFSDAGFAHLLRQHYQQSGRAMRACHPRDLLRHILALARYYGIAPEFAPQLIDAACQLYFVDTDRFVGQQGGAASSQAPAARLTY
jgi:predicted ATPase with chaperone activity